MATYITIWRSITLNVNLKQPGDQQKIHLQIFRYLLPWDQHHFLSHSSVGPLSVSHLRVCFSLPSLTRIFDQSVMWVASLECQWKESVSHFWLTFISLLLHDQVSLHLQKFWNPTPANVHKTEPDQLWQDTDLTSFQPIRIDYLNLFTLLCKSEWQINSSCFAWGVSSIAATLLSFLNSW